MSEVGKERLFNDLKNLGYQVEFLIDNKGTNYVVIREFLIPMGQFEGRIIDLAIPVPNDYPRVAGPCIHIRAMPQLLDNKDTIKGKRNIINSPLGSEWKYWSFRFNVSQENATKDLMVQINGIFKNI